MNDKSSYQSPEVIESLDEVEVLATTAGSTTDVACGSSCTVNAI